MDDLTKGLIEHLKRKSPGIRIQYFDASEGIPVSDMNSIEHPTFPPKNVYKDFPLKGTTMTDRDTHFQGFAELLVDEIKAKYAWIEPFQGDGSEIEDLYTAIARRAYDFAK